MKKFKLCKIHKRKDYERMANQLLGRKRAKKTKKRKFEKHTELSAKAYKSEVWFKNLLYEYGVEGWLQNYPVGKYYGDFVFTKLRLIIEVDGSFHNSEGVKQRDRERTRQLEKSGWMVLRVDYPDTRGRGRMYAHLLSEYAYEALTRSEIRSNFSKASSVVLTMK